MAQWDAFISYARSASTLEAQKLQIALQTFAKPWHRLRAVRVFRDDSSMSANPGLWSTIEQGLREARWLVVLLSPAAARSEYVANEIGWWLQHKDAGSILLVHDEGTLGWDRARNDFSAASDCVPAPLRGAFREEPRWTDLSWFDAPGSSGASDPRFVEKVADLASAIRGVPRDELLGEDVAQHKRSWRLAKVALGTLTLLLIASVVASILAIAQRNEVLRQANTLLARQLAATSDSLLDRDLRRAQLLAVQAYRTEPTPETRAALLRATLASPALRRFVTFDAPIRSVDASASGRFLVAGLTDGRVVSWDLGTGTPVQRLTMQHEVLDVAIGDEGTVVAAVDGSSTYVAAGTEVGRLDLPQGQEPTLVTVNPSGTGVVVASKGDNPMITLADLAKRNQRTVPDASSAYGALSAQFVGGDRVLLAGSGGTEVRTFPGFERVSRGTFFFGARQVSARPSADGVWTTATNGASEVPVWRLDADDQGDPPRYAVVPMTYETASALNHDGTLLAVADASGVRVAQVRSTTADAGYGNTAAPAASYPGTGTAIDRGVLFLGSSSRFAVASGRQLSLWDPDSAGRAAATATVSVASSCTGCGSPTVALSPDGTTMAVRDGDGTAVLVGSVPGRSGRLIASFDQRDNSVGNLATPVWLSDDSVLVVASGSDSASGTLTGPLPGLPAGFTGWAIGQPNARILAVRPSPDGATTLVVDSNGRLARYRTSSGQLVGEVRVPGGSKWLFDAAISPDLASVALVPREVDEVIVVDAATGTERYRARSGTAEVARTLFAAGSLWIRGTSGAVQRHDPATGALQRVLPGTFPGWLPLVEASGTVAIPDELDTSLYDATADTILDDVPLPADQTGVRRGVALSADGSVLVTVFEAPGTGTSTDGLAVGLNLDPERLVATACRTSGGSLTAADWTELIGGTAPADLTCR